MDSLERRDLARFSATMFSVSPTEINCRKTTGTRRRQIVGPDERRPFASSRVKRQIGRDLFCSIGMSLLLLFAVQKEFNCLRISSIVIPPAILNGSQTTLVCNYELGPGDQLYSVTWYKDRVGFYRYQSAADAQDPTTTTASPVEQQEQNLNLNQHQHQSHHQPGQPTNAKHEFDWAGISLDLARSNSTHVHLKQVGLNSEGTFECEVIADAPTFATVSASRQMKVYVLPKRKLSLVDNSQQAAPVQYAAQSYQNDQQHQSFKQNIYQLNDLLNFTCSSGPSRPAARLSWLLNDMPIGSFQPSLLNKASDELRELQTSGTNQTTTTTSVGKSTDLLAETRSTLVLRLQASHLRQLRARTNLMQHHQQQRSTSGGSYLPIKLSCVSELSVEFTSNTSLLISGGKTSTTTKRSRTSQSGVATVEAPPQPEASSWRFRHGSTGANPRKRPDPGTDEVVGDDEDTLEEGRGELEDKQTSQEVAAISIFRWQPPPAARQRFRLIGADCSHTTSAAPTGGMETNYAVPETTIGGEPTRRLPSRHLIVWTNRQLKDQSDHIECLLPRSNANQLEPAHIEAQTVESSTKSGESAARISQAEPDSLSLPPSSSDWLHSRQSDGLESSKTNKDFELHELVNFTCRQEDRGGTEQMHSVDLRWFLNDREVVGDLVNAFDQVRGFHFDPNESHSKRPILGDKRSEQSARRISANHLSSAAHSSTSKTSRSLLIEFSQNLFRLKELNLRCKTIIEQPLIEFESSQLLYLATSPFIQAQDQQPHQTRPSLYNVNPRHRQQPYKTGVHQRHQQSAGSSSSRQHQANVIRMRPQSSRTSSSSSLGFKSWKLSRGSIVSHFQWLLLVIVSSFVCF